MQGIRLSLVFNELSVQIAPDRETMNKWLDGLIEVFKASYDRGIQTIRTSREFSGYSLMDGYSIGRWLEETESPDADFTFDMLTHIKPYDDDLPDLKSRLVEGFMGGYEGQEAIGLGYAYLLQHLALSVCSNDCWDIDLLPVEILKPDENFITEIRHAANRLHLDKHHPPRKYEHNPKHHSNLSDDSYHAPMNLTKDQAQEALNMGVQPIGLDEIYSFYNNAFFVFRLHDGRKRKYHGYKLSQLPNKGKKAVLSALLEEGVIDQGQYNDLIH